MSRLDSDQPSAAFGLRGPAGPGDARRHGKPVDTPGSLKQVSTSRSDVVREPLHDAPPASHPG
ncbi:hypothetical protein EYF80_025749 [Liparis tanakae]|uniref:Uncharacterized protein n=1 Tax=Liparis tanakae TaxID=230148 RepID=A0A4Z2HE79_9TELE|nr:hypothetical protein EYF80_025749 [Liparis tanakae]